MEILWVTLLDMADGSLARAQVMPAQPAQPTLHAPLLAAVSG